MTVSNVPIAGGAVGDEVPARVDAALLRFTAEMHAVQLDQLVTLLKDRAVPADLAAGLVPELVSRWCVAGDAETERLTLGEPWVWATRKGQDACGLRGGVVKPRESSLRHTHAVTDVRLAVERTSAYRQARGSWRAERSIRAGQFPERIGHVPDGEVHWPAGTGSPSEGETWAVEVEIARKSVQRIALIMQEALARTGDWNTTSVSSVEPDRAPRYARLVYVCSPQTVSMVLNARAELGKSLSARIDVHDLPESAMRFNTPKRGWQP
jgi:hypothetical protein